MAKKIDGWVDAGDVEKAEQHPDKYSHVFYTEQSCVEGITTKATLVVGDERVFTESEVKAMLRSITHCTGSPLASIHIEEVRRVFASEHDIVLDPA